MAVLLSCRLKARRSCQLSSAESCRSGSRHRKALAVTSAPRPNTGRTQVDVNYWSVRRSLTTRDVLPMTSVAFSWRTAGGLQYWITRCERELRCIYKCASGGYCLWVIKHVYVRVRVSACVSARTRACDLYMLILLL